MKFKYDHDLHIHTHLSACSGDKRQTPEYILEYARTNKLHTVAVTDHYWDRTVPTPSPWYEPQNFDNIVNSCPLPSYDGVKFLFGCETDMNRELTIGIPKERYNDFGFIIVPTTHMHMKGFTIYPEDADSEARKSLLWVKRLEALLNSDMPFNKVGVAHLACPLIFKSAEGRGRYLKTLELIPGVEMERLFAMAKERGVGIELNSADLSFSDSETDTVLRMFKIAKNQGCKFYLGTDAHHPEDFKDAYEIFDRAITLLDLKESDKFDIASL